jgi:hypothetical protein
MFILKISKNLLTTIRSFAIHLKFDFRPRGLKIHRARLSPHILKSKLKVRGNNT